MSATGNRLERCEGGVTFSGIKGQVLVLFELVDVDYKNYFFSVWKKLTKEKK